MSPGRERRWGALTIIFNHHIYKQYSSSHLFSKSPKGVFIIYGGRGLANGRGGRSEVYSHSVKDHLLGGEGVQKSFYVHDGGGEKSFPSSLRGVQKVFNVTLSHLPAPLPVNNEHSLLCALLRPTCSCFMLKNYVSPPDYTY